MRYVAAPRMHSVCDVCFTKRWAMKGIMDDRRAHTHKTLYSPGWQRLKAFFGQEVLTAAVKKIALHPLFVSL